MLFVNKAIISRSVRLLESHHLVVLESRQRRSRRIYLTSAGVEMFYRMRPISAHGQDLILAGMTPEQIDEVNSQLRRMLETLRGAELFFGSH
jgi:DNA-binding MarR family transcriptional regulator